MPNVCTNKLEIWGDPEQLDKLVRQCVHPKSAPEDMDICLAELSSNHGNVIDYEHLFVELRKRDAVFGYGTIGRPFPNLFFQDVSRQYRRLTLANTYMQTEYAFCGVSVWRNGNRLYERHIDNYWMELPDPELYDDDHVNDALIDLMASLSLEAAMF